MHAVGRHFGDRKVLSGIDLDVTPGDRVAVTGPNGSGKTTLLRIAAGVLRPTEGSIERPRTVYLPQDAPVYPELTPAQHLRWWCSLYGTTPPVDALHEAGLAAVAHDEAAHLSRGQRQRLGLSLALAVGADVAILDEPYTALDASGTAWLDARLRDTTVLFSCHDDAARRLDARVLALEVA